MVEIEDVRLPILPSRKISTISIPNCDGERINSTKYYSNYSIEIDILIDCDSRAEVLEKLKTLKDIFDVSKPKPFSINDDRFILAISNDAIEKEAIAWYSYRTTIKLYCAEPYFYSYETTLAESYEKAVATNNNGNRPTDKGSIIVGFTENTYFAQLEQKETGQKMLFGSYPKLELSANKEKANLILDDDCSTLVNWTAITENVGTDRGANGTLSVSGEGGGIILGTVGSDSTTWKGASARQNLSESLDEFEITVDMAHNSYGENGDPSKFSADKETSEGTTTTGSKETYYKVTCNTLNYRSGPGTKYKKLGSLKKGFEIFRGTLSKGWLKFSYNNKTCYCCAKYLTKKIKDTTKVVSTTITKENVMAYNTTGKGYGTYLFETPGGKKIYNLRTGTKIRIISSKKYTVIVTNGDKKTQYQYYKLAKKVDGHAGYVNALNVLFANEVTVDYDALDDVKTADDKTGVVELRGYTANSEELFCISLIDDNEYFEYTRPHATICNKTVLKDANKKPVANTEITTSGQEGNHTITVSNTLSGQYGDWNDFHGSWTISRKKINGVYEWNVTVKKIKNGKTVKTQKSINLKDTSFSKEAFAYVKIYLGTTKSLDKSCAMNIEELKIKKLNATDATAENIYYFKTGDVLEVDLENHRSFLNEQPCDDIVDIGSRYFNIPTGESTINLYTDDVGAQISVVFRQKYLGDN